MQNLCQWQSGSLKTKNVPLNSSLDILGWFLREREAHSHGNDSPEQKEVLSCLATVDYRRNGEKLSCFLYGLIPEETDPNILSAGKLGAFDTET